MFERRKLTVQSLGLQRSDTHRRSAKLTSAPPKIETWEKLPLALTRKIIGGENTSEVPAQFPRLSRL
jgi:hypothetical protein